MTWGAVAIGGAALVGGIAGAYITSQGQQEAAETQQNAANAAANAQLQMYYQNRQDMMPWRAAGAYGLNSLVNIIGAGPGGYRGTLPYYDQSQWTPTNYLAGGQAPTGQQPYSPYGGGNQPYFSQAPPGQFVPPSNLPPSPGLEWNPDANPPGWGYWGAGAEGTGEWHPFQGSPGYVWDWTTNQWVPTPQGTSTGIQRSAAAQGRVLSGDTQARLNMLAAPRAEGSALAEGSPQVVGGNLAPPGTGQFAGYGPSTMPNPNEPWINRPPAYSQNPAAAEPVPPGGSIVPPQTIPGTPESVWGDWSDRYVKSPYYNFLLGKGTEALERGAASRGRQLSGAENEALLEYGQGMASMDYDKWLNRWYQSLTPLQSLAGVGQTAATTMGNWGQNAAGGSSAALMAGGAAQAAGQLGQANTWGNLLGWGGQQAANLGLYGQSQGWWGGSPNYGTQYGNMLSNTGGWGGWNNPNSQTNWLNTFEG